MVVMIEGVSDPKPLQFDPVNKLYGSFVAHVVSTVNPEDQGILYIRTVDGKLKNTWYRVSRDEKQPGVRFDVVKFNTLTEALDDARNLSRCGAWAVEVDQRSTPFTDKAIQVIVEFLEESGQLPKAA